MRDTLEKINRALQCACERNDVIVAALDKVATETTLVAINDLLTSSLGTIESLLQDIETGQDDLTTLLQRANWTSIPGNSIEINYYAGVSAGNPSGNTSNIETTVYKTGASVIFTQTMTYNASDLIISVSTT